MGGGEPPKKYVEKLKSGGQFNFRFKNFMMGIDLVKFSMDDFYSNFDALKEAPDGDLTAYHDSIFLVNLYSLVLGVCTSLYQYENIKKEILEKNVANFILVALKLCTIKQYKASKDRGSILQALLLLADLMSFDLAQVEQIIFSDKLLKKMQSIFASNERKKGWKPLDEYYDRAVKSAIEYWEKKDKRLHHEMANDLISEISGPVIDRIRKELLKKYSKEDPSKQNEDAYKKELKIRISYETMSARTLRKKLQPIAIKYKKFYDPGSRARGK